MLKGRLTCVFVLVWYSIFGLVRVSCIVTGYFILNCKGQTLKHTSGVRTKSTTVSKSLIKYLHMYYSIQLIHMYQLWDSDHPAACEALLFFALVWSCEASCRCYIFQPHSLNQIQNRSFLNTLWLYVQVEGTGMIVSPAARSLDANDQRWPVEIVHIEHSAQEWDEKSNPPTHLKEDSAVLIHNHAGLTLPLSGIKHRCDRTGSALREQRPPPGLIALVLYANPHLKPSYMSG